MNKMMILYTLSIFSIISVLCKAENLTLPVTTCKRNTTDYSTCLKIALEESWPRFIKGLPEFDFPPLEPFFYKYGRILFNHNGISGEGIIKNCFSFGLAKARFLNVRPHFLDDFFRLEIDLLIPEIFISCNGSGQANLIGIRASGTGQVNVTINGNRLTWDITGHVKNDTWIVEHFQMTLTIERAKIHLIDFFEGIKELNDVLETFLNEYWPSIYRVIGPAVFKLLIDPKFTDLSNRLFSKVSFSKVFP